MNDEIIGVIIGVASKEEGGIVSTYRTVKKAERSAKESLEKTQAATVNEIKKELGF